MNISVFLAPVRFMENWKIHKSERSRLLSYAKLRLAIPTITHRWTQIGCLFKPILSASASLSNCVAHTKKNSIIYLLCFPTFLCALRFTARAEIVCIYLKFRWSAKFSQRVLNARWSVLSNEKKSLSTPTKFVPLTISSKRASSTNFLLLLIHVSHH